MFLFSAIPYFTVEPELQNKAEGETAEFMCEASGIPPPQIKWIYNGMPIEKAPANSRRIVETNRIVITNLKKEDTGNYGCNATNVYGYTYRDVYVNVLGEFILIFLLLLWCFFIFIFLLFLLHF